MRARGLLVTLLVAVALLPAGGPVGSAAPPASDEPGVFSQTLPNGLLVLVRERPSSEVAAIDVAVRGGSRDEEPETVGAAHFMEHMYFQGTPTRPSARDIDREITSRGGWLNGHTGWESVNFQAVVPSADFDLALSVVSDQLVNSLFEAPKIDKERRVVLEELNRRLSSPSDQLEDLFARTIFEGHPAENLPIGNRETLARATRDVLVAFRDTYFVANNMVLAVVGNLPHEAVFARVGAAFADMRAGPRPASHPAPPPTARARTVEGVTPAQQAWLAAGVPAPGYDNADRYAMDVLAAVLGEAGRRLQTEIVEHRGLASDVRVTYTRLTDTGFWKVSAAAPADNVQPLLDIVREQIRQIRETPLADADLDKAKAYLRGSARLSLESSTGQAQRLADGAALGYYEPLEGYLERIMATTPADVHAVANKYLDPDALTVVILRPQAP